MKSDSIQELAKALAAAQGKLSPVLKNKKNPFFKSSYADLASCFETIREVFSAHGLSVSQPIRVLDNGRMALQTLIMHESGQYLQSEMILPDIHDPQKMGGAVTYYRRYSLMAIAGLPCDDDDGNQASVAVKKEQSKPKLMDLSQELEKAPEELRINVSNYLDSINVTDYSQVPEHIYRVVMSRIEKRMEAARGDS